MNAETEKIKEDTSTTLFNLNPFFLYDWFLIELANALKFNLKSLINILCLNRKINEKAKLIFKKYLFDRAIQSKLEALFNSNQIDAAKSFLESNFYAIHPNFNFGGEKTKLIMTALQLNWKSLISLIYFHPRMKMLEDLKYSQRTQILNWAVENDCQIVKHIAASDYLILSFDHLKPLVLKAIEKNQSRLLEFLTNGKIVDKAKSDESITKFRRECLELSISHDREIQVTETLLNCDLFSEISSKYDLYNIIRDFSWEGPNKHVVPIVELIFKEDTENQSFFHLDSMQSDNILSAIQMANNGHVGLQFTYFFCLSTEFHEFFKEIEDSVDDEELLHLLRMTIPFGTDLSILECVWNHLSPNAKIDTRKNTFDFDDLFKRLIEENDLKTLKLIMKHERFYYHDDFGSKFVFKRKNMSLETLEFLIPFCDLSEYTYIEWITYCGGSYYLDLMSGLKEIRNMIWLDFRKRVHDSVQLDWLQEKLKLEWTEELLDLSLRFLYYPNQFNWLAENKLIDKKFWNWKWINYVFEHAVSDDNIEMLKTILKHFPKFDIKWALDVIRNSVRKGERKHLEIGKFLFPNEFK